MTHSDFRSDSVTQPTDAMREAMARAEVGDDGFGEDPTAHRLEELSAAMLHKEAAVFCPSNTMANLLAILAQAPPGSEALCEARSHCLLNGQAGASRFAGVQLRSLPGTDCGTIPVSRLEVEINKPGELHAPQTALVIVDQTHHLSGGHIQSVMDLASIRVLTQVRGIRAHMDGTRLFHAVVESDEPVQHFTDQVDTVAFSLCHGLCAPAGAMLCGDSATIQRARSLRQALGGGMHQIGVLAAAGIVALETMIERLAEDHALARSLAEGLARISGVQLDPAIVETNVVLMKLPPPCDPERHVEARTVKAHKELVARLRKEGILVTAMGIHGVRFVTHRDVNKYDVDRAVQACRHLIPSMTTHL